MVQVEKLESECSQLQQELQDSKDQNELLEFRILELEVSSLPTPLFRSCILGFSVAEKNTSNQLLQLTGLILMARIKNNISTEGNCQTVA